MRAQRKEKKKKNKKKKKTVLQYILILLQKRCNDNDNIIRFDFLLSLYVKINLL